MTKRNGKTVDYYATAELAGTLSHPRRLHILSLFLDGQEHSQTETIDHAQNLGELSQPTVSHHLGRLAHAGLVTREKRRVNTFYTLNSEVRPLLEALDLFVTLTRH